MVKINKILVLFLSMFVLCSLNAETNSLISVKGLLNYLKNKTDSYGSMAYQSSNNINVVTGNFQKVGWSSGSNYTGTDTTLSRQSAGVLQVGTGSTGNSLGSLSVSNVYSHDVYVDDIPASWSTSPIIPSLYKNITDLGAPASPVIVNLTPAQTIYKVEVSAVNTLSNNFSGISFSTARNVEWETWINYTTTNSLSTTWPANIEWDIGVPELTVTGQYKFAFSTIDGLSIRGKQVYPTVHDWESLQVGTIVGSYTPALNTFTTVLANNVTTQFVRMAGSAYNRYQLLKLIGYSNSAEAYNASNQVYATIGVIGQTVGAVYPATWPKEIPMPVGAQNYVKTFALPPYSDDRSYGIGVRYSRARTITTGSFNLEESRFKLMNELEIKAYNQGWRP